MTDYRLCRAKIESPRISNEDNRYLCRIIPDMNDIAEKIYLPEYPVFLRQVQEAFLPGDIVWTLVTEDFQIGYIIGICENPIGRPIIDILTEINLIENEFNITKSSYEDLSFSIHSSVYVDFHNIKTLTNGRINKGGTLFLFTKEGDAFIKALKSDFKLKADGTNEFNSISEVHNIDKNLTIKASNFSEEINNKVEKIMGSLTVNVGENKTETVLGSHQIGITGDSTTMILKSKTDVVGTGRKETITTGGAETTVLVGDYKVRTTAGMVTLTSLIGGVEIIAGLGGVKIMSGAGVEIISPTITLSSPIVNMQGLPGMIKTGTGVAAPGVPGPFCAIPFCLFAGAPHTGNMFTGA